MIHATAVVDTGARIADDVEIGPYCVIGPDVEIGAGTVVGPHVVISGPTRIGRDNRIFQFASVGEAPQDKKYNGEPTWLIIGDRNIIREYVTLNRGTLDGDGKTIVGNDNLFMAYSHIAHDCIVGNHTVFANCASLAGHVSVGDYTILGGFTLVHQFTTVADQVFCGFGSNITQDIPPYSTTAGDRARVIGINKEGLRRKGFSEETIRALHKSCRELLKSNKPRAEVLAGLQPLYDQFPEVRHFIDFVTNSRRGIPS